MCVMCLVLCTVSASGGGGHRTRMRGSGRDAGGYSDLPRGPYTGGLSLAWFHILFSASYPHVILQATKIKQMPILFWEAPALAGYNIYVSMFGQLNYSQY